MKNSLTKFKSLVLFSPINSFIFFLISIFSGFTNSLIALSLFPLLRELDENSIGDSFILNYFDNFMAFLNIEPNLITVLIFMLLIVMISSAIDIVFELFAQNTCANLRYSLSTKLFNKILDANWKFFREKKPGEIINSIFIEIQKSVASYKDILELMSFVSQFLFYVSFCFLISFYITSATIIVGLLIIVIFIGWNKKAKKAGYNYNLASKILTSEILDTLKNMKNIKASGRANLLLSFFIEDFVKLKNIEYKNNTILVFPRKLAPVLVYIFLALGVYTIIQFELFNIAELIPLIFLYSRIVLKLTDMQSKYQSIKKMEPFYDSYISSLELAKESKEISRGTDIPKFNREISFRNVDFKYQNKLIFQNLNLKIKKNSFNIILGKSGMGKTTLLDLICNIITSEKGQILIDDNDIKNINLNKWRNLIGYVSQEGTFYNDTLLNNLTYKDNKINVNKINEVLDLCELSDFLKSSENGIYTVIGEGGSKLSGGQRQRLSIARALITSPAILILDESTNSLDQNTKLKILKNLKLKTKNDLTIIMTTHDENLIEFADFVYEVKNFGIAEQKKILIS